MEAQWTSVRRLLENRSPLAHPEFIASAENLSLLQQCKVLVIGAGGLGCELLKDLAMSGFRTIHVIDTDTVELSNLNRQFLFRDKDIGASKAVVAARVINSRVAGCNVTPHFCRIEDKDSSFYEGFHIVVAGLDSISARRWINRMLLRLLRYNEDGTVDPESVIPLVDGGVEGFKGNVRVILPGLTACIECYLDLYPPPINYPLCTISNTPRSAEHCIEYARVVLWPKERPFDGSPIDGDNTDHLHWIYEKSLERARHFGIEGVTYRLTKGVVKNIIPAVASTNAVVAAACALEVFKLATSCTLPLKNYMSIQDAESIYVNTLELEKRDDCLMCNNIPVVLELLEDARLCDLRKHLMTDGKYNLADPSFTSVYPSAKLLYAPSSLGASECLKENLNKTLQELGLNDQDEVYVSDLSLARVLVIRLKMIASG